MRKTVSIFTRGGAIAVLLWMALVIIALVVSIVPHVSTSMPKPFVIFLFPGFSSTAWLETLFIPSDPEMRIICMNDPEQCASMFPLGELVSCLMWFCIGGLIALILKRSKSLK